MSASLRGLLILGVLFICAALSATWVKRRSDGEAYYNFHLRAAIDSHDENLKAAEASALPLIAADFEKYTPGETDIWPLLLEMRADLYANKQWDRSTNWPRLGVSTYHAAKKNIPDLDAKLDKLSEGECCQSLQDLDQGAMVEYQTLAWARGFFRLFCARAEVSMNAADWKSAESDLLRADRFLNTVSTGPNRDGVRLWAGAKTGLVRVFLDWIRDGKNEPERLAVMKNYLAQSAACPDMSPAIHFEFYKRYWAAQHFPELSEEQIRNINVQSPNEHQKVPSHAMLHRAMQSRVLASWSETNALIRNYRLNPGRLGNAVDDVMMTTISSDKDCDYLMRTNDPVFGMIGASASRTLELSDLAWKVVHLIEAEHAGRPLPDPDSLHRPQHDYEGRTIKFKKLSDGWVLYMDQTSQPESVRPGLTDEVKDNIIAYRHLRA